MSMPYYAFDREFFKKWQSVMLWALNTPIIKRWARHVSKVNADIENDVVLNRIEPSCITYAGKVVGDKVELTSSFRGNNCYAIRLYHSFKYVWWTMHFIDWLVLDRQELVPNFGFLSLVEYPEGGTGTPTAVNGHASSTSTSTSWATKQGEAGDSASTTTTTASASGMYLRSSSTTDEFDFFRRGILCFDTSSLTSGATISAAVMRIVSSTLTTNEWSIQMTVNVFSAAPAVTTAIAAGDFDSLGATQFSTDITAAAWDADAEQTFTLNASGIAGISKTSVSSFGLRESTYDAPNSAPVWESAKSFIARWLFATDTADTANDPRLTVTYTIPEPTPATIQSWEKPFQINRMSRG